MSNCTSGCKTQDHDSYADCLASKTVKATNGTVSRSSDYKSHKLWETEIREYRNARSQGIQPKSTSLSDIRSAVYRSELSGTAVKEA